MYTRNENELSIIIFNIYNKICTNREYCDIFTNYFLL